MFFRLFKDADHEYLRRVWLIDPEEAEVKVVGKGGQKPWNGEYYVSFGEHDDSRRWVDAQEHGYIAVGGGTWYSNTLSQPEPGARVWVNVPAKGYVGVGIVTEKAKPIVGRRAINQGNCRKHTLDRQALSGRDFSAGASTPSLSPFPLPGLVLPSP